jgi:lysylphosphatidylglycerol synthetase-like protein (DUF2156 family)
MTKRQLQLAASVLIFVALFLIVVGLENASTMIWVAGLIVVGAAMVMSLATRWAGSSPE